MTNTPNQNNEDSIARDPKEMPSGVVAGDATISQTPSDPKVGVYAESLDILNGTEVFSSRKGDYLVARNVYTDAKPHVYDGLTNDEIIDKLVDEYDGKSESKTKKIEDADQQEKRSEDLLVAEVATDGLAYESEEVSGSSSVDDSAVAEALEEKSESGFLGLTKWGWTGLGLLGIGVAVSGDDSVPPPDAPSLTLNTDSGVNNDGVSNQGGITVAGLDSTDPASTWEYSLDGGSNWQAGQGNSISVTAEGSYSVVARQTVGGQVSESSVSLSVTVDQTPATLVSLATSAADQTISVTYDSEMLESGSPATSAFTVRQGGAELVLDSVSVSGAVVTLSVTGLASGSLQVSYEAPGDAASAIQDNVGNLPVSFSQIVVSDGYIRGAEVYLDANGDGVAEVGELLSGVTSNSSGEILLDGAAAVGELIIKGGVNVDTGAVNELTMAAPAGYSVVNPLSTIVAEVIKASDPAVTPLTVEEAEAAVSASLGITLAEGEDLSSYDPLSDTSEAALSNQKVTAQLATVLVIASTSSEDASAAADAEAAALSNIANIVVAKAEANETVTIDAAVVAEVLVDDTGASLVSTEKLEEIQQTVAVMEQATSLDEVVVAQAAAIDSTAAAAPLSVDLKDSSDSGISNSDDLTSDATATVIVGFDTAALDGTAVVVGDAVELVDITSGGSSVVAAGVVTEADLAAGNIELISSELFDGSVSLSARITDVAGNVSGNAGALAVVVDTTVPSITSSETVSVDENSGSGVVYTALSSDAGGGVVYALASGSDASVSVNSAGAVTLAVDPDYETQTNYVFTVVATDAAGNSSEQAVALSVTNLDDTAPTITSGGTASAIAENSGAGQVVYTVTSDDSADVSGGVSYTLGGTDAALMSIDSASGAVTLTGNPDEESQASYAFTVTATDAASNSSEQAVTLSVTDLDDTAPTITSGASATVLDYQSVIYTVVADDSADVSSGVSYSLEAGVGDAGILSINSSTGVVSLASGVTSNADKSSFTFTVLASDGINAAASRSIVVSVDAPTDVSGPGVVALGGLKPSLTVADGVSTLSVALDPSQVGNYSSGIENVDFTLVYNVSEMGTLTDSDVSYPAGGIASANTGTAGQVGVAVIWFPAADADVASITDFTYTAPEGVTTTTVSLNGVIVGANDLASSTYTLGGDTVVVAGTANDEVFHLLGGAASVTGGGGADTFVVTVNTGTTMTISDFEAGVDTIEIGGLAIALGYTSTQSGSVTDLVVSELNTVPSDIASLITGNDSSLDNSFGAYFDDTSAKLTLFIDSSTSAGTVTMATMEITLTDETGFSLDDLDITSAAFIA